MNHPEIEDFSFDEITNNQTNIWKLRDELNATRRWIREHVIFEEDLAAVEEKLPCTHEHIHMLRNHRFMCDSCKKFVPAPPNYQRG